MEYRGRVEKGVVVMDSGAALPEGTVVRVEPIEGEAELMLSDRLQRETSLAEQHARYRYRQSETGKADVAPCRVVDLGDGPKIEGTRITVYTVLEYLKKGRTRDWIAAMLGLSSRQVQAAIDYLHEHADDVNAEYEKILARIRRGNPPWVEERLKQNRAKFEALRDRCRSVVDAEDHVRQ